MTADDERRLSQIGGNLRLYRRQSAFSRGQASLEMTLALIGALLLLAACINVFVWLNGRMADRQQAYESSRASAANSPTPVLWNEPANDGNQDLRVLQ